MNKLETVKLFALIAMAYPRDERFTRIEKETRDFWGEMLADIPFDAAKAALKAHASTSPFPPSIAEIRDYATRQSGPRRMTADEAWGKAHEAMRKYGLNTARTDVYVPDQEPPARFGEPVRIRKSGLEYEAKRHCPPEVWAILERMGYADVYMSDAPDVVRGQFMRSWSNHDQEAKEERVIGGILPELYGGNKQIGGMTDKISGT